MTVVGDLGLPVPRLVVPINEPVAPVPAEAWPVVTTGGQATAHAPLHSLVVPESFSNRYRVRPCESTRIVPSLGFLTTATVACWPVADDADDEDVAGVADVVGVAALLPLLQPAAAIARSGMAAAPATTLMYLP